MPALAKTQREAKLTVQQYPVRLGPAEESLISQLESAGAAEAAERFRTVGLPTRRVESYHYTDLKMMLRDVPELAGAAKAGDTPALDIPDAHRFVIVNGAVQKAEAPEGIILGTVKGSILSTSDDALVRVNTALVKESLKVNVDHSVNEVIHIDRRMEGEAGHVADAASFYVADGAHAVIVETVSGSDAAHVGNHASHVTVGKRAHLTHILVDMSGADARHFATVEYDINEDANIRSMVLHAGSSLERTQIFARFSGERSHGDFTGLNLVEGKQHADITLELEHAVPNTTSAELYKSVGRGRGKAVFQGKIMVAPHAQKTDAQMMSQGLMLSGEAEIYAKPELEIFADDVVCGHGSTCGDLDADNLFYLMSRGIKRPDAEAMLVRAFLEELFDPLEDEGLVAALSGITEDWLSRAIPAAVAE